MTAQIISSNDHSFKILIEVPYSRNMLEGEEVLQQCLNSAGVVATQELLNQFDTDGTPIEVGGINFTAKKIKEEKEFQSPYGPVKIDRFIYQSSNGGSTYVPLDVASRIIITSTPKFSKMISSKYSCDGAPGVQRDLEENHNRKVALSYIKNVTDAIGTIAMAKEESWSYTLPDMPKAVKSISVGLDGTCLNMIDDGWREAMCGTIAFFDNKGERMHTIYAGASPEYGKGKFLQKFGNEVDKISTLFPQTTVVGLADGASSNWSFLEDYADILTIDFWHFSEYLAKAAVAIFPNKEEREEWLEEACSSAKHKQGGVSRVLKELKEYFKNKKFRGTKREDIKKAITYISNHLAKMKYYKNVNSNMPIGSGVTEAACKTLVKQRMCKGSARWKDEGASVILTLRSLHITERVITV